MTTALICGVNGQDGAYLAALLLTKGYNVIGSSRDAAASRFENLERLGVRNSIQTISMATNDFRSVLAVLRRYVPDEIYHLSGQSSVALSFEQPVEAIESIALGTLNLLEAIRFEGRLTHFYHAGSSECFGDSGFDISTEATPFRPRSPYAVAKVTAHNLVANYREAYGIHACTGILFNHESPLRPRRFVTQKIVYGAALIARGSDAKLKLGNLDVHRDWGWAPEYVDAMWRILQVEKADDYIVATGRTVSLAYFAERAFAFFGLNADDYIISDPQLLRPTDIRVGRADARKAAEVLGWSPSVDVDGVIDRMCRAAMEEIAKS